MKGCHFGELETYFMQTVDILKRLITEAEGMEYTEWYFRTEEGISNTDVFVSNNHIFQLHF